MPKKKAKKTYSFKELEPDVQAEVLKKWREHEHSWDYHDAEMLSETFKEILEEKGFQDDPLKVYWSLGYCQGDGVCFDGWLDVEKYIKLNKLEKFEPLVDKVDVHVINRNNRYCHWNSMDVEIADNSNVSWENFVDSRIVKRIEEINQAHSEAYKTWYHLHYNTKKLRRGVKEWLPPGIESEPPKHPGYPDELTVAKEAAERHYNELVKLGEDFRDYVDEDVKSISRELEKIGYEEIEYRTSDEVAKEFFEANEYEFEEDGEII